MCTAIRLKNADVYFGRNLDLDKAFGQKVVFVPRDYAFRFRDGTSSQRHPALLGMATVVDGYPLFADAMNENGLAIAGLNFPGNAHYFQRQDGKKNVSPFELIPHVLSAFSCEKSRLGEGGRPIRPPRARKECRPGRTGHRRDLWRKPTSCVLM